MRICIIIISLIAFAQASVAHEVSPVDSVGIKNVKGKKFILYKIDHLETWFRISRRYGLTAEALQSANEEAVSKPLKVGQILLVPVDTSIKFISDPVVEPGAKPVMHKVKNKETLYSIAVSSGTTMRNIRIWNNLKKDNLTAGQMLIVGYIDDKKEKKKTGSAEPTGIPAKVKEPVTKKDSATSESNHKKEPGKINSTDSVKPDSLKKENKEGWKAPAPKGNAVEEHGMATFIEDEDINPHKYYALHRIAPKGTIMKVTNIMNKKQIYVKVIGTLPNTGDNNDLIIKISKASAMKLGVLDSHFQVVLNYYGE